MTHGGRELADTEVRSACEAGDLSRATTLALERHGSALRALLFARLRRESDAEEVFAVVAEKVWRGLSGFEWRTTLRSWLYRLARNAANDWSGAAYRRPERNLALSQHEPGAEGRPRTETPPYRKTAIKDRVRALREQLPFDDRMLLHLRVEQQLDWQELAIAMADGDEHLGDTELVREAARLRKRFERAKQKLRELAEAEGLI